MNFKAIITVGLATLSGATLAITHLSTPVQAKPTLKYNSPGAVTDVILFSQGINRGKLFKSDKAVADLSAVGFNNRATAIQVNNSQKWRFYTGKNFTGKFIEIGPNEGRGYLGNFASKISSFKSVK
jgi:hypothetical protein